MDLGSGAVPSYPSSPILRPPKLDARCTATQRCRNYTASILTVHSPVPQTKVNRKFSLTVTRPKVEELTRRHEEAHQPRPGLPLWVARGPTQLAVAGLWGGSQKGGKSGKNRVQSSLPLLMYPPPGRRSTFPFNGGEAALQSSPGAAPSEYWQVVVSLAQGLWWPCRMLPFGLAASHCHLGDQDSPGAVASHVTVSDTPEFS